VTIERRQHPYKLLQKLLVNYWVGRSSCWWRETTNVHALVMPLSLFTNRSYTKMARQEKHLHIVLNNMASSKNVSFFIFSFKYMKQLQFPIWTLIVYCVLCTVTFCDIDGGLLQVYLDEMEQLEVQVSLAALLARLPCLLGRLCIA